MCLHGVYMFFFSSSHPPTPRSNCCHLCSRINSLSLLLDILFFCKERKMFWYCVLVEQKHCEYHVILIMGILLTLDFFIGSVSAVME
jgi:hypothetical protein